MNSPAVPEDLLDELQRVAMDVATGAAQLLRQYSPAHLKEISTKSSLTDHVSEADRASEAYILSGLRQTRPSDSIRGEEGSSHQGTSGVSWVADPLDGTTNFLFEVPAYSVSLAAEYGGRPVVGVVVDVSKQETWSAAIGRGAWRDGSPCRVANGRSTLATALVATGFSYSRERRAEQAAVLQHVLPAVRDIRRFGSAALDLCWLAAGRVDAFYEAELNDWDWAAGRVIAEEAGAQVTMLAGSVLLAATPELFGPLADLLDKARQTAGLSR